MPATLPNGPAAVFESAFTPDGLAHGQYEQVSADILLAAGQTLTAGALLGLIAASKVAVAAAAPAGAGAAGANTGSGTVTLDPATPALARVKLGTYLLKCLAAGAGAATFQAFDPEGEEIGQLVFGAAGSTATLADQLKLTLAQGAAGFVAGDGFSILVSAAAEPYRFALSAAAAQDGSANPRAVLMYDTDASAGDTLTRAYFRGGFFTDRMSFGAGIVPAQVREDLLARGLFLIDRLSAA